MSEFGHAFFNSIYKLSLNLIEFNIHSVIHVFFLCLYLFNLACLFILCTIIFSNML